MLSDANGNIVQMPRDGKQLSFTYGANNRLTQVIASQGASASNKYDGHGRRVERVATNPDQTRDFIYEGTQLLAEYAAGSNEQREYLWFGHDLVASLDTTPKATTVHYVATDFLGSQRRVTTAAGQVIWSWLYTANPFGERSAQGSYTMSLRFPGQYHDALSGTNYNVFRDYDPYMGRYTTSDPSGLGAGMSTYTFLKNNPNNGLDPLGLWSISLDFYDIFGGGVTFGRDARTGGWFISGRIGMGVGGGFGIDPFDNGPAERERKPNAYADPCDSLKAPPTGTSLGSFLGVGASGGLIGVGIGGGGGVNLDGTGTSYGKIGPQESLNPFDKPGEVSIGGAVGLEVSGWW